MKKFHKAVLCVVVSLALLILSSCAGTKTDLNTNTTGSDSGSQPFKIGVLQLVTHDALDASYKGFVDALKEAGLQENVDFVIDYQNAQGEQANCQTIAAKFVNDKVDLILAIATPASQAAANETKDIPILVTAVTDPADAKLVNSNELPGTNVSGTSDLTPVKEQIELLKKIVPNAKKIALLYNSSETNSLFQIELAKEAAEKLGLEYMEASVSQSSEIQQVVESVVGKVDAIYTPTDNMIAAGMSTVALVANEAKIPVIVGEEGMVSKGGLATYGINYYDLGKLTGKQAVDIIKNNAKPAEMPIQYLSEFDLIINQDTVEALGIQIPEDLLAEAKMVKTNIQ